MEIDCPHRSEIDGKPVCQIVADLIDLPLADCHVNDSACNYCLGCGIAPQAPNIVTASMSIGAAQRTRDTAFIRAVEHRMRPHLRKELPPETTCILRGNPVRLQSCKPCQASGGELMVPVFRCPIHQECTLHNTGLHPRIHACATCGDRKEQPTPLVAPSVPPQVLQQIHARGAVQAGPIPQRPA